MIRRRLPLAMTLLGIVGLLLVVGEAAENRLSRSGACQDWMDSTPGDASWSWLPPGTRCAYPVPQPDGYERPQLVIDPSWAPAVAVGSTAALVAFGAYLSAAKRRS